VDIASYMTYSIFVTVGCEAFVILAVSFNIERISTALNIALNQAQKA
jgi:hypothetical protein